MFINLAYKFQNLDGSIIMQNAEKELDLKEVVLASLVAPDVNEPNDVKVIKYDLAKKLYASPDTAQITVDDASLIKASLPMGLSPVITAQVIACLEYNEPHSINEYTEVKADTEND
jgi:hypothetical protein